MLNIIFFCFILFY